MIQHAQDGRRPPVPNPVLERLKAPEWRDRIKELKNGEGSSNPSPHHQA